jgi:hypothetical protein
MVAIVKSSHIDGLTRVQIMPYWWTTAHWRAQYADGVECRADIDIGTIKKTSEVINMTGVTE